MSKSVLTALSRWFFSTESQPHAKTSLTSDLRNYLERQATVTEMIQPGERGRVWFQATTWFAVCPYHAVLLPETPVRVIDTYNATTLIVEPMLLATPRTLPPAHVV